MPHPAQAIPTLHGAPGVLAGTQHLVPNPHEVCAAHHGEGKLAVHICVHLRKEH